MRIAGRSGCVAGVMILLGIAGCKSAYIEADVTNTTSAPVSLVEMDYPSASFGVESLAAGATYHYRFKVLGSGATKILWTDAVRTEHTVNGPALREGQQGALTVSVGNGTAVWKAELR